MKKKLIAVFLALILMTSLVGCGSAVEAANRSNDEFLEKMGFVVIKNLKVPDSYYTCRLAYDIETGVMYYLSSTYNGGLTLCPRYDENGEVMIYGGE